MSPFSNTQPSTEIATQRCIEPNCAAEYSINERLYVCRHCGSLLDVELNIAGVVGAETLKQRWAERRNSFDIKDRSGVWRYRELLPFAEGASIVSLYEGNTPLYEAPRCAAYAGLRSLKLKHQGCNPTGSFKDTGMTTAVTQACILSARTVVCASTGNTAASLAAYAARAGLSCAILVPHGQVSHAKLAQSLDYGAQVLEIDSNFDSAMRVIQELADDESIYLVNSINPFRIEGQKTVAAELLEQLDWQVPDHVVMPGGNLGNSSALGKGFSDLLRLGLIDRLPEITVVQAEGAAPFAKFFARETTDKGSKEFANVEHPQTLATAIKIGAPVSWPKAWRTVTSTKGRVLAVSEQEIADAKAMIGRDGIGCEPASATTVAGIKRLTSADVIRQHQSVVAILTGHELKDTDYVIRYHRDQLIAPGQVGDQPIKSTFANRPIRVAGTRDAILKSLRKEP